MTGFNASVSGIQSSFTRQNLSANNISNINTSGFKSQQADQVEGLVGGTDVSSISAKNSQGSLVRTGRNKDLAVSGDGQIAVKTDDGLKFTRSGSLGIDAEGNVVNQSTGGIVQSVDENGRIDNLSINDSQRQIKAKATDSIEFNGNLPSNLNIGESAKTGVDVFDSQGGTRTAVFEFTKTDINTFDISVTDQSTNTQALDGSITFDTNGNTKSVSVNDSPNAPNNFEGLFLTSDGGADPVKITEGSLDFTAITQQAGTESIEVSDVSGREPGRLESTHFTNNGNLVGTFDNGENTVLGTVALASFQNPSGLNREGDNLRSQSANSGIPQFGAPGTGGRGKLQSGVLEASNVSLAEQAVEQISARTSAEANVGAFQTRDEMMGELLDILG